MGGIVKIRAVKNQIGKSVPSIVLINIINIFLPPGPVNCGLVIQGLQEGYALWNNHQNIHLVFRRRGLKPRPLVHEPSAFTTRPRLLEFVKYINFLTACTWLFYCVMCQIFNFFNQTTFFWTMCFQSFAFYFVRSDSCQK